MKLSVVLIVKDEEKMLERCLESVKEADEIIICDTGSKDGTIEIAKKYTDKVFTDYKWEDHYANARNHAKSKATGEWILSIDADEYLEEDGIRKVKDIISQTKKNVINVEMFPHGKGVKEFTFPRIFKNIDSIKWEGRIHNYINDTDSDDCNVKITYAYSPAHAADPHRSLRMLIQAVKEEGDDSRRNVYYLGREYHFKKIYEMAIYYLKIYVERSIFNMEKADAYYLLGQAYFQLSRIEEAKDATLQSIKLNPNFKAPLQLMADLSGPTDKKIWLKFKKAANNKYTLFTR